MTRFTAIPTAEFKLGADVWLQYRGANIPTSIKVRAYDPDKAAWLYRVALSGEWHKASELSDRSGGEAA